MKVAIQGEAGAFHQLAAQDFFGLDTKIVFCREFADVFAAVESGQANALIVAIENSVYGSINPVYDLIETHNFPIIGEVKLRIAHQLVGVPGAKLDQITHVYSQSVALAQCSRFLDAHPQIERVEFYDTAAAAKHVMAQQDPSRAAISSAFACEYYGGEILAENIENHDQNYTRFLAMQPNAPVPTNANKSSVVITTDHKPGALYAALRSFASRDINLAKLQSRPIQGRPWHYKFYAVLETAGTDLHEAVAEIRDLGYDVRVLGEYLAA